jgi:SAM-dependent methyltransferase
VDSLLGELRAAMHSTARACIYRAPGECLRCPSCGSSRLYELDLLTLQRPINGCRTGFVSGCDGCGLVFSNPQPTAEELRRFYSPTGEWGARRVGVSKTPDVPRRATRGRSWSKAFGPIRDFVTTPRPGATALDFGCGDGALLDALQESGWDTSGIETAVDCAFPRHHRLDAVPGAPVFDLIVANHVLEHVTDPLGLLHQFARAGRVGGYLFIGVPRFDTLPIHRDYKYVINGRAHVTAYTWPCLQGLLARAGWKSLAPPPARVSKGRSGHTCARLRVIAQRIEEYVEPAPSPATAARRAVRRYYADVEGRPVLERMGWYRLAARSAEVRRKDGIRIRKSGKRTVGEL